jgi:hypothetical protein
MGTFVWGQSVMPGTFTQPVQSGGVMTGPLLTPPVVSLGSGLTPPTVINGQTMFVSAPLSDLASASAFQQRAYAGYITPVNGYVPMPRPAGVPFGMAAENSTNMQTAQTKRPVAFDFIIAPRSNNMSVEINGAGVGETNLGKIAAALRKGPPPAQRTFTNEDIARLNEVTNNNFQMPGASTEQPSYPQERLIGQPQQHSSIGSVPSAPGAKPSPSSPKPRAEGNTNSTPGGTTTEIAEYTASSRRGSEENSATTTSASNQQQAHAVRSPSSGTRELPGTSTFLPLAVLCGLGITAIGVLLAGKHS